MFCFIGGRAASTYYAGWLVYAAPFRVYGIDTLFTTDSLLAAQPGASC